MNSMLYNEIIILQSWTRRKNFFKYIVYTNKNKTRWIFVIIRKCILKDNKKWNRLC